jgi:hypothetical protein
LVGHLALFDIQGILPRFFRHCLKNVFEQQQVGAVACRWAVLEIEPFLSPALDRFPHWKIEIVVFLSDDEADSTDNMRTFASAVALDIENLPPKIPVGVNAEEYLAYSDGNDDVEDGVWSQLPKLNPIGEKKATEEIVGWKRKPTVQKGRKHNSEALWCFGREAEPG